MGFLVGATVIADTVISGLETGEEAASLGVGYFVSYLLSIPAGGLSQAAEAISRVFGLPHNPVSMAEELEVAAASAVIPLITVSAFPLQNFIVAKEGSIRFKDDLPGSIRVVDAVPSAQGSN